MPNPFEAYAERNLATPHKRRIEKKEAKLRQPSALEIKQAEDEILAVLYRRYHRGLKAEIAAAHGADFKRLESLLRALRWSRAEEVVDHVFAARWLRDADDDTKLAVLGYIDESFCRARVRDGRSVMDDGLWDEPLTPFLKVRHLLFGY